MCFVIKLCYVVRKSLGLIYTEIVLHDILPQISCERNVRPFGILRSIQSNNVTMLRDSTWSLKIVWLVTSARNYHSTLVRSQKSADLIDVATIAWNHAVIDIVTKQEMSLYLQCLTKDHGSVLCYNIVDALWNNLLTPNVNYSSRTAPLTSKVAFYIFIQQI